MVFILGCGRMGVSETYSQFLMSRGGVVRANNS